MNAPHDADPLQQIDAVADAARQAIASVTDAASLEAFRVQFLGTKGQVKNLPKLIAAAPPEQKKAIGAAANAVRQEITQAFEAASASLARQASATPTIDVTEPGLPPRLGNLHVLQKCVDELAELFGRMGFTVAAGPEVEDDFHNFVALNIPAQHPARDPLDNFYLSDEETQSEGDSKSATDNPPAIRRSVAPSLLLRTQTSTVQIRVMQQQPPPIRVVIPGRVYRPDTHDDTHLSMFHQLEALVVDEGVTMVDLKSTILQFVHAYFGPETRVRFRPSFFPFTEPSAEVDVWFEDKQKWIELGGCGMVHPNVLRACNVDPERFTGWAFGFGIERIAMRKYGVGNIRQFVENDVRFLRQF